MKTLKVIIDTDELYMAMNEAGHMYVSKSFLGTGILVSTTRSSVLDIQKTLTHTDRDHIEHDIVMKNIGVMRFSELNCIYFSGQAIDEIRERSIETAKEPGTGPHGTRSASITAEDQRTLDEYAAVIIGAGKGFDTQGFIISNPKTYK